MKTNYDVVVIGAGSGGLTSAVGFSKVGKSVLLIEAEHMGGECTNSGCVPSKALLHHAKSYHHAKTIAGETAQSKSYRRDALTYVRSKVDEILEEETPEAFEKIGIDVVMGRAAFTGRCSVEVNGDTYHFTKAVIATGSTPREIDIKGLSNEQTLTNQNIFALTEIPERLLVVGSGPIGMEMGQAFAMLGSAVTIATIDSEFARLEDEAIRPIAEKHFTDLGITILKDAHISEVAGEIAHFTIKKGDDVIGEERVAFDKVLVAIGRVPNLPDGLDAAGIEHTKYGISVNKNYRTKNKDIYAVGDVSLRLKFTHTADDAARHVVTKVITHGLAWGNTHKAVPKVTYTNPEIAQVGISYHDALKTYTEKEIMRIEVPYTNNDRAKTDSHTDGLLVVIVRRVNGAILGAHIIGPAAGEMIALFTLAMDKKISMWGLRSVIYAYPTYSLVVKKAGDFFFARQIADLKPDLLYVTKKHAPKIIAVVFWVSLLWAFFEYRERHAMGNLELLGMLFDFVTSSAWGALAYIVVYAIRPLIFFPATLLTFLSGALFGFWWGVLYTIIGENMSANFAYWIGRFFGKDLKLEDSFIGAWVSALRKRPFESVLFMRLFYVPFDITNYGSGILRVKWPSYFLATLIGIMPGLTVFVALGAAFEGNIRDFTISFDAFNPLFLSISIATFVGSIFLGRLLKRWRPEHNHQN